MSDYTQAGKALAQQAKDPTKDMQAWLEGRVTTIEKYVRGGVRAESLVRWFLVDYNQSKQLQECSKLSIYMGLLACAQTGLEPGGVRGEAYLIPYKKVATFVAGWKGLVKLARRSKDVVSISSNVVFTNDDFDIDIGSDARVVHKPPLAGPRGELIGAYAQAKLAGGGVEVEWIDLDELEKFRSRSVSPAWKDWGEQMARKAPLRRLCKRLPLGTDYFFAATLDEKAETGDTAGAQQFIDIATEGAVTTAEHQDVASEAIKTAQENL